MPDSLHYPATRRSGAVARMHGVDVADPYDWLGDSQLPEVREWLSQQNRLTGEFLGTLGERKALREYIRALPPFSPTRLPFRRGSRDFTVRVGSRNELQLIEAAGDTNNVVLDTATLAAMKGYVPNASFAFISPSARYVVIGASSAGSDWAHLFVIELATGKLLPGDWIPTAHLEAAWAPDESGFYYCLTHAHFRESPRKDGVYWHSLAGGKSPDKLVFDHSTGEGHVALPLIVGAEERLLVKTLNFVTQDAALFVVSRDEASTVRPLIDFGAPLNVVGEIAGRLYIETRSGAPKGRIVALDLGAADARLHEVVAEQDDALEISNHSVAAQYSALAGNRLFLTYVKDVAHCIRPFDLRLEVPGTSKRLEVPGTFTVLEVAARAGMVEVAVTSFATPFAAYRVDPQSLAVTPIASESAFSLDGLDIQQRFAASADGTRIPYFVIRRDNARGPQPTLLYGYGGWGSSLTPSFRPDLAAWVQAGGTYAIANTRGGGEYGKAWHDAGARLNRHKTFEDFSACAKALVEQGYARAGGVVARGLSNGGLLVTSVMMREPELFTAILAEVPLVDVVRLCDLPAGAAIALELGDATADPATFRYLLDYSPLQNVRPHPKRPALMLIPGGCDERAPPAGAFKLTAALQATAEPGQVALLRLVPDGGHGGWPWPTQCEALADGLAFLWHYATHPKEST